MTAERTNWQIWQEVFAEEAERERLLAWKHKWVPLAYNWFMAALLCALFWSAIAWGNSIHVDRVSDARATAALEAYQAEQDDAAQVAAAQAEAERQQKELEATIEAESDAVAQMLFGIRNFQAKYSYTEKDLETYVQSAFNRADARGEELIEIIFQEGQYIAASRHNDITADYKALAKRLVASWHNGEYADRDTGFQYAELTPYGLFLKKGYGEERWKAQ